MYVSKFCFTSCLGHGIAHQVSFSFLFPNLFFPEGGAGIEDRPQNILGVLPCTSTVARVRGQEEQVDRTGYPGVGRRCVKSRRVIRKGSRVVAKACHVRVGIRYSRASQHRRVAICVVRNHLLYIWAMDLLSPGRRFIYFSARKYLGGAHSCPRGEPPIGLVHTHRSMRIECPRGVDHTNVSSNTS